MENLLILQLFTLAVITLLNIRTYLLYFIDKKRAVQNKRNRISEKNLLLSAVLFGGIGALLGMALHRHKTKHFKFTLLVPFAAIMTAYILLCTLS